MLSGRSVDCYPDLHRHDGICLATLPRRLALQAGLSKPYALTSLTMPRKQAPSRRVAKVERRTLGDSVGVSYDAGAVYASKLRRRLSPADAAGELRDILVGAVLRSDGLWVARIDKLEIRARAHNDDGDEEYMLVTDVEIVKRAKKGA